MQWFFTADTHFYHENIIEYSNRPFGSVYHMNETLIKNWNSRVKPGDIVFHLGDFAFKSSKSDIKSILDRLNGQIILIKGNHDSNNNIKSIIQDLRIFYGGKDILLTHRAEEASPGYYLVLCGHAHNLWKFYTVKFYEFKYDCCNVGVDVWSGMPITIQEIFKEYEEWKRTGIQDLGNWHLSKKKIVISEDAIVINKGEE